MGRPRRRGQSRSAGFPRGEPFGSGPIGSGERRRCRHAAGIGGSRMSPAPRAAAVLAGIALLTALTSPAVGAIAALILLGVVAADAMAVWRAPEVRPHVPDPMARGVHAPPRAQAQRPRPG